MTQDRPKMPTRLQDAISGLERYVLDEARSRDAAELQRVQALREVVEARERLIKREQIPLEPDVRQALVWGRPLGRMTSALAMAQQWLRDPRSPPTLVLVGTTGCGKSTAAGYLAVRHPQRRVKWRSASAIVRTFAGMFGEALVAQQRLFDCDMLVVEDVGTETHPERMEAALVELLEARGKDPDRRTVITTNLSEAKLFEAYPDVRLHSRLGGKVAVWRYCVGQDLRR